MARDSRTTRTSLLRAATDEFAAHGIAGARVDRIAAAAGYNKNLIYVHFGSKEQLFDAVYEAAVEEVLDAAPFDADDLPGYAGALFDFHLAHPHLMRLARWHSLERPGEVLPIAVKANAAKLRALAAAQGDGRVDAGLPPHLLLSLLVALAATWNEGSPEPVNTAMDAAELAARRHAVVVSVGRLTRPPVRQP
ncbi:TetR family transcriptional regulator [Streptomyces sp. AK02-01A]|uniref:TetR family transcriptional regulator n=1 Tax=Streptomyces sp. AK02-01A TaxID=3028648 RepID=UPI0029B08ED7|nr:TetR family transcriptional regulator [Streptomyces sp. AK02-01A]MDX3851884.1 TetR family transcriptional regulator [Streptomyces sp. AK02-01A]